MSAPYTSPPPYSEAVHPQPNQYDNLGYSPMNDPMSPAMVAAIGRPSAAMSGNVYNESTAYTDFAESDHNTTEAGESSFGNSFLDKAIRRAFIRKVYMILLAQMSVTVAVIAIFIFVPAIGDWIIENIWFYGLSYAVFIVTYLVLVCVPSVRRKHPGNLVCLSVFTIATAFMLATISSFHSTTIVLIAIGVTAVVCLSISLFAMQTKIDFTLTAGLLFTFVLIVMLFGLCTVITQFALQHPMPIMNNVYGALLALLFAWFLVFDTQTIIGGKKIELSPEEYIFGALQLYMDIINLFLIILSFLGRSK